MFYERELTKFVLKSLKNMPIVFLNGPRQAGKTTLAKEIADKHINADYVSFDDMSMIAAADSDPESFLDGFNKPVVLDEIQLVPKLFRTLKKKVDSLRLEKKRVNGRFLLTGSTNIMTLPLLSDALVGRMDLLTLYPISSKEFHNEHGCFIKYLFVNKIEFKKNPFQEESIEKIISKSTFPQISVSRSIDTSRWFESYISTLIHRDLKTIAEITKLASLSQMLKALANRAGSLLNSASLARDISLNNMTFLRYKSLLHGMFLIMTIPPWHNNLNKRLVKSPKIYFIDTFLLCHLLGVDLKNIKNKNSHLFGKILENFIASEITKQISTETDLHLFHFRTSDNKEVDFVIEKTDGDLIGIEVKSSTNVTADDFLGLKTLKTISKDKFIKGVVLYQGKDIIPFGKDLFAMPISSVYSLA